MTSLFFRSVFEGHEEGALCCDWSPDGALLAVGGAGGELRLHAPPPRARQVHLQANAHDLGTIPCIILSFKGVLVGAIVCTK